MSETKLPIDTLRATGNDLALVLIDNTFRTAALEGLTIDVSDPANPVLRSSSPALNRVDYVLSAQTAEFGFPAAASGLMVYRNGILMSIENDYVIAGQIVRFVSAQIPQAGDTVIMTWLE